MSQNNENKLVPRLRFPEFNDNWNPKQICDLLEYERPDNYIVNDTNYTTEGTPVLTANKSFILGYTEETNGICEDIPAIIFDDFTVDKKFVDFPFKVKSSAIKILRPKGKDDLKFIFELMSLIKFEAKEHKRYYISAYQNLSIPIPKPNEQQKIAACLSSLDDVITAESKKLEVLKEHKKGLLQNLFPQEGETVPKLRFKEFENSGEWEVKKLGDIGVPLMCKRIFKEETTTNSNDGVPFYKIGTFGRLADSYISKEIYEEYKSKYSFPKDGDILISASGTIGRLVIYDGTPAYFQDSNIIWLGHNEEKILNKFLFYCYSNLKWQTSDGGVISRLYNSDFIRMTINFPEKKEEQQKITACLSSIDDLINAQSQKIETLKLHKKGLLQGLFPDVNEHNG